MQTTASGLKYEVLKMGNGRKPTLADNVTVHYRGELTNGTVFDSSYDRGEPATFPLARVVKGWQEGVQLMPVGSTFRFEIPPDLGYGSQGAPGAIPPNATLIFQVELISIN
jgi:FKBP-type peptidyl-prolyl cis-trans isomerase